MERLSLVDGEPERLIESLIALQARYPSVVHHVVRTNLTIEITFFVEELAMNCTQALLDAGITAVHRLDNPRVVSLHLPSLVSQQKLDLSVQTFTRFMRGCSKR